MDKNLNNINSDKENEWNEMWLSQIKFDFNINDINLESKEDESDKDSNQNLGINMMKIL